MTPIAAPASATPEWEGSDRRRANGCRPRPVRVSLVVPALNEERNIGSVLDRVPDLIDEVIVVDGNSTDETVAVCRAIRPDVRVIAQSDGGKGAAVRAGFRAARGDVVVMIDADCSMDPQEIGRFLHRVKAGDDVVKGSRFMDGGGTEDMGWLRAFGNRVLCQLVNRLYGVRFTDLCYGFVAFRREALAALELRTVGFEIETEITVRAIKAGLRLSEVPSVEAKRAHGKSNLRTWRDGFRALSTLIRERLAAGAVATSRDTRGHADMVEVASVSGQIVTAELQP
jgi:glycosyltransferase involved in cell wall biosynthesis